MKIAVDIDDVLANSHSVILDFYKKYYDPNFDDATLSNFAYLGFLGKTKEEAEEKIHHLNNSEYFDKVMPYKDAQDWISKNAGKHEFVALTSRPLYIQERTEAWVRKYFPQIKEVMFNNRNTELKGTLTKQRSKSEICIENGFDVLIDDLLKFTNDSHPNLMVFLFDRPWNQGNTPPNVTRIKSWDELTIALEKENKIFDNLL